MAEASQIFHILFSLFPFHLLVQKPVEFPGLLQRDPKFLALVFRLRKMQGRVVWKLSRRSM